MTTNQPYDFSQVKQLAAAVKPKAAGMPEDQAAREDRLVEQVSERNGFSSREANVRLERIRSKEPIDVLSLKGPLSVLNAFKKYCNEEGQPYWRVLQDMLKTHGRL